MNAIAPSDVGRPVVVVPWTERAYQGVLTGALGTLGFFVLFSTAGVSLSLFVLFLLALAAPLRVWRLQPWREPVLAIGLVLLGYIAIRILGGDGVSSATFGALNRYHELLMLALLWALMRLARRPQAFSTGLMAGALVFAAMHWLAPYVHQLVPFLASRRISGGFGLAVCAFLLFEHGRLRQLPRGFAYSAAAFLAATVIFASEGRTGHVVLLVLLACAAWRATPLRIGLRLPAVLVIFSVGIVVALLSHSVQMRLTETVRDAQATLQGEVHNTSTGARIELLRNGLTVAGENWAAGTGWLHYPQAFERAAAARHGNVRVPGGYADNPHNEYLMQLGAGGLPALVLFLLWLGWPMWRAVRESNEHRPWAGAVGCVALAFATGCLFNSMLLDFVEGHFYAALMAWLLVRRIQRQ